MSALKKKKEKPAFARNVIARKKALGWNNHTLAQKARVPFPTVRGILAGYSNGLYGTKVAIASALGCTLADLEADPDAPKPMIIPSERDLKALIEDPRKAQTQALMLVLEELLNAEREIRAATLAILFDDPKIAEPYLSDDDVSN